MVIYKTTNKINGKIYIGQTTRTGNRLVKYLGSGTHLTHAIKKYGKENFVKEIIEECNSVQELDIREKFWIYELNSQNPIIGYNIASGGDGGDTLSNHPNIIDIVVKAKKTRQKFYESLTTIERSTIFGRPSELNRVMANERYSTMSKEEKSRLYGRKGKQHHNFGKKNSIVTISKRIETRRKNGKMSNNGRGKRVAAILPDSMIVLEFISMAEACKYFNISRFRIKASCRQNSTEIKRVVNSIIFLYV